MASITAPPRSCQNVIDKSEKSHEFIISVRSLAISRSRRGRGDNCRRPENPDNHPHPENLNGGDRDQVARAGGGVSHVTRRACLTVEVLDGEGAAAEGLPTRALLGVTPPVVELRGGGVRHAATWQPVISPRPHRPSKVE